MIPSKPLTANCVLCPFSPAFQCASQVLAACLAPQAGSFAGSPLLHGLPGCLHPWALTATHAAAPAAGPVSLPWHTWHMFKISCLIKKDKNLLHIIQQVVQIFYMLFPKIIYKSSLFISMLKHILKKIDLWNPAQKLKLNRKKIYFHM